MAASVQGGPSCGVKKNTCDSGQVSNTDQKIVSKLTLKVPETNSPNNKRFVKQKWEKYEWQWSCTTPRTYENPPQTISCRSPRVDTQGVPRSVLETCVSALFGATVDMTNMRCLTNCEYPIEEIPARQDTCKDRLGAGTWNIGFKWYF